MEKSTLGYPQFFHTLVPGFHTQLVIPLDFFFKYVQGKNVEDTVEVKSDSSDITWKVKMTGSRLIDGWEEFAVGNNLQIGDVLLVRYVGDLVLHVSNLGPSCFQTPDKKDGKTLLKKRLCLGTQVDDGEEEDNMELPRKKKVKMNSTDGEAGSSSSFDNSSFVANVTALSLRTDTMYLPEYLSEASGRESLSVVKEENIIGGERSEDEFNSMRSLVETESSKDKCSSIEPLLETEKTKYSSKRRVISYSSYSPCRKEFVTFTLPPDYIIIMDRLRLPKTFTRENGIDKPGNIYLVGKGGKKCQTKLLRNKRGAMSLGKGWKYFVEVNDIEMSFTLKLLWKDTTPVLCLCDAELNIDREQKKSVFIDSSENPRVTLTMTPSIIKDGRLRLPKDFTMENDINKPCMITLMSKDGLKQQIKLLFNKSSESMALGCGLNFFVKENGINIGDSFTLELIWEDTTPVLRLCNIEHSIDERGGCSETIQKKSLPMDENIEEKSQRERDSTPSRTKQFVTFKITPSSYIKCRLIIPMQFVNENKINNPGMMYLVGKDGRKWPTDLRRDTKGTVSLGHGWRNFGEAYGLKVGESFTMELIREGENPLLRWVHTELNSSKANEKESVSTELRGRDSSSTILNQFVTLAPTPEDVSACQLYLKTQFKKGLSLRTQVDDGEEEDKMEFPRKKRVRMNSPDAEAHSSSSLDNSSFVANVTASSLCTDTMYLPEDFTSTNDLKCSSMDPLLETEKAKYSSKRKVKSYSSYSPCRKEFVTFTLPPDYIIMFDKLTLPMPFTRENGIDKPGEIYLVGKGGKKCRTKLLRNKRGAMSLGKGWKYFVEVNDIKMGFTLKLLWKDTTPVLCLCDAEFNIDREQEKSVFIDSSENQLVTLTITQDSITNGRLRLPKDFTMENGINKPGMITLLGKYGIRHQTSLLFEKVRGSMALGGGFRSFVKENGIKIGDSFTLELIWEDTTPVFRLCNVEHSIDKRGGCSEPNQEKSLPMEPSKKISKDDNIGEKCQRDSTPSSTKQFVILKTTPSSYTKCRLIIPMQFLNENKINKPGMMYLVGKDGRKWPTDLRRDTKGTMGLGHGWRMFGEAHGLKVGESFTMELIREGETPLLRWVHTEPNSSKANEKESVSTEPRGRDSSSAVQNKFVTLAPTSEDVSACQLYLTTQFMKANGINKLGKITILGENGKEWFGYLLSKDGLVALGIGWDEFCEANGVKSGECFTLESINVDDKTSPVLKLCSPKSNKYR